jgi:hypothetical protein
MNKFAQMLALDRTIVLDGGLATQLESMGFDIDGDLWSAKLLDSNPQAIIDAHRAYLDAGADCIISASYQASRRGFMAMGKPASEADELIASAVMLAIAARDQYVRDNPSTDLSPLAAASVGPYGATVHVTCLQRRRPRPGSRSLAATMPISVMACRCRSLQSYMLTTRRYWQWALTAHRRRSRHHLFRSCGAPHQTKRSSPIPIPGKPIIQVTTVGRARHAILIMHLTSVTGRTPGRSLSVDAAELARRIFRRSEICCERASIALKLELTVS